MEKEKVLVSACLLGAACRYDGRSKPCQKVIDFLEKFDTVPVCPECLGGLPTPRVPSEIVGERVLMKDGADVTENFKSGAARALDEALKCGASFAVLKSRSPSCGCGAVYDGTFTGTLRDGDGVLARMLLDRGFTVLTEEDID